MNDDREHLVLELPSRGEQRQEGTAKYPSLFYRRLFVLTLVLGTYALALTGISRVLANGGWSWLDVGLLAAFALSAPWTILSFWNALIGLILIRATDNPLHHVAPYMMQVPNDTPLTSRVAVLMTLRNEPPARALQRLTIIRQSLDATGNGARFDYYVLSDTSLPDVAAIEEAECAALETAFGGPDRFRYRRRALNVGYKAGNVRDFCERWGHHYEFMLPLDSDSLMSGNAICRLVRICEANRNIGILQSLVVGTPARSGFARIFQFGMRHGMRSYTMGSAWWQGDCGPYWGHNALLRVRPFADYCDLPVLSGKPPLGGYVLSHDQIEAVLMRRAGYEVRVLPDEGGSWEDNPPTLTDFTGRDLRWCQGNMQYFKLLTLPGLKPTSRVQVALAILMYLGSAAWMAFVLLGAAKAYEVTTSSEPFPAALGLLLFFGMFFMSLAPKIAGLVDVMLNPAERARYGGAGAVLMNAAVEFVFTTLLAPIAAMRVTIFMVGLLFGRTVTWDGQERDDHSIGWRTALKGLWPQTLAGLLLVTALSYAAPAALPWAAPILIAFLLSIPFTVLSSRPGFGAWCKRNRICAIPEELTMPIEIQQLHGIKPVRPAARAA